MLRSERTQVLKNICHPALPPHHSNNSQITMQNGESGLHFLRAESVGDKKKKKTKKKRTDGGEANLFLQLFEIFSASQIAARNRKE